MQGLITLGIAALVIRQVNIRAQCCCPSDGSLRVVNDGSCTATVATQVGLSLHHYCSHSSDGRLLAGLLHVLH